MAAKCGIQYRTLQAAIRTGRLTHINECKIAELAGFDVNDRFWVDLDVSESERGSNPSNYRGLDTLESFRKALVDKWSVRSQTFRAISQQPVAVDRDLACHEISDCGQATSAETSMELFLQADLGTLYDPSGIKFGFRKIRISADISCERGAKATDRLGKLTAEKIGNGKVSARGTDKQPSWEIEIDELNGASLLDGEYSTTSLPLMRIVDYQPGTRIETKLIANMHDGDLILPEHHDSLSANKKAILEQILSMDFAQGRQANGKLELSRHEVVIKESR